jgi:protocatechuate 3,4-dioxygenase beta subunit
MPPTRRHVIRWLIGAGAWAFAGGRVVAGSAQEEAGPANLAPTPACGARTPPQTAGPFFSPSSPERTRLREDGMPGVPLSVRGRVLSTDCRPVPGALLEFWQCDGAGRYDNEGYRLRGHQRTDRAARFRLETIKPSVYGGTVFVRTPHIHVKVLADGMRPLTTQLYFPDEPTNARDTLFDPRLTMDVAGDAGGLLAEFDFVLA